MTVNTPLGGHHAYTRKRSLLPRIKLRDYAKGREHPRKFEKEAIAGSKKRDKSRCFLDEIEELNREDFSTSEIIGTLSPEAYVALMILHEQAQKGKKTNYGFLKTKLGKNSSKKARKARNELERLGLAYFEERHHLPRRSPEIICCISETIQPELEAVI